MASPLTLHPLKLNRLDDIAHVNPVSNDDACLLELGDVLIKHGYEKRLGIALLHKHFDLASDEALLESCDRESRTLTMRPVKRSALGTQIMETLWQVEREGIVVKMGCENFCPTDANGKHSGYKDHYDTEGDEES